MTGHLVACTLTAIAALAAVHLLRGRRAAWRHVILFVALLRFAIPTSWISAAGRSLAPATPSRPEVKHAADDLRRLLRGPGEWIAPMFSSSRFSSSMFSSSIYTSEAPRKSRRDEIPLANLIWAAGIVACAALYLRRALRRVPSIRPPSDYETEIFCAAGGHGSRLRIVAAGYTPGAHGCFRPAVILPDGLSAQLSHTELEGVIAHELAHIRRLDNLIAAISHAVVSVFWFHPLCWWIERRMLAERETACDEMVLARGIPATDYAAGILKVCCMPFAAEGYAGADGSNLQKRMEFIMSATASRRTARPARVLAAAALTCVSLLPAAAGYLNAQPAQQSSPASSAEERLKQAIELLKQKQYDEAEQAFRDAYSMDPSHSKALAGEVETLNARGRWDEALTLIEMEVAKAPNRLDLEMIYGNTAVRAGRYDLAESIFDRVLTQTGPDPKISSDLYLRLGETYRREGNLEKAISNLRKAAQLAPDNATVLSTLAISLDAAGKRQEAEQAYRDVIRIDPDNTVSLNNLAFLLAERAEPQEALPLANRARELSPELPEISDTLGWIHIKLNQAADAIRIYDDLVRKEPARSTYRYHFAVALNLSGDSFAAGEQLRTALTLNPPSPERQSIQELLDHIQK